MIKKALTLLILVAAAISGASAQKIYMIGDSHVAGKIYPRRVGEVLNERVSGIEFDFWGKNGATFNTFNESPQFMQRIYDADPDILIVHLGTNDSYTTEFREDRFERNLEEFYNNVSEHLPHCQIVFVTPFYNKVKEKGTRNWVVNESTRRCADALLQFAADHPNCHVADNNADHGMEFLDGDGLIRNDYVHLSVDGYRILGEQVARELLEIPEIWYGDEDRGTTIDESLQWFYELGE